MRQKSVMLCFTSGYKTTSFPHVLMASRLTQVSKYFIDSVLTSRRTALQRPSFC